MSPFLFFFFFVSSICSIGGQTQNPTDTKQTPYPKLYDPKIEHLDYQTWKPEVGLGSCDEGY